MQEENTQNVKLILERLKNALNVTKDSILSEILCVKGNVLANWKKRNSIDYPLIFTFCEKNKIDLNYVIYGKGEIYTDRESRLERSPEISAHQTLEFSKEQYGLQGSRERILKLKEDFANSNLKKIDGESLLSAIKEINKLRETYEKRFEHDLAGSNEGLLDFLRSVEHTGVVVKVLFTVYNEVIDGRPDPFSGLISDDIHTKSVSYKVGDADYKDYKSDMLEWLEKLRDHSAAIKDLYNSANHFLQEIKPLDKNGVYEW